MKKYPTITEHKWKGKVKVRQNRQCIMSDRLIEKGSEAFSVKILPSSSTGHLWDLKKPVNVWFCGECSSCHSGWGES